MTSRTPGRHLLLLGKVLSQTEHVRADSTATRGTALLFSSLRRMDVAHVRIQQVLPFGLAVEFAKGQENVYAAP